MPRLSSHIAVIECVDKTMLEELLAAGLARYVVRRLSDRVVVVDHSRLDEIQERLRRLDHSPKVTAE